APYVDLHREVHEHGDEDREGEVGAESAREDRGLGQEPGADGRRRHQEGRAGRDAGGGRFRPRAPQVRHRLAGHGPPECSRRGSAPMLDLDLRFRMPEIAIQTADGAKEPFSLVKSRVTIGRSRESDIFLPDQWLSRHHAEILQRADGYYVLDLQSKNGTLLNGQPVRDERRLREGDVITLGEHSLTFCMEESEEESPDPEGTRVFSVKE